MTGWLKRLNKVMGYGQVVRALETTMRCHDRVGRALDYGEGQWPGG